MDSTAAVSTPSSAATIPASFQSDPVLFGRLVRIAKAEMWNIHQKRPKPAQLRTILNHIHPTRRRTPVVTSLVALGCGSGKSASYQAVGTILPGRIVLCIHPLLALSADQHSKLPPDSRYGGIRGYHLDALATERGVRHVLRIIHNAHSLPQRTTYFLFASPQCLTNPKKPWAKALVAMYRRQMKERGEDHVLVLDETHLWPSMGFEYRLEFLKLNDPFLKEIRSLASTSSGRLHVMLLSTTLNADSVSLLSKLSGFEILPARHDVIWGSPSEMSLRKVNIDFYVGASVLQTHRATMVENLRRYPNASHLFVENTRHGAISFKDKLCDLLDSLSIPGDAVLMHGELSKYEKFYRAKEFVGTVATKLSPRFGVCMEGGLSTGTDKPDVVTVSHGGFPSSIENVMQEMGRLLRGVDLEGLYAVVGSVASYAYLFAHAHSQKDDPQGVRILSLEEKIARSLGALNAVLSLFVLATECVHMRLEAAMSNPYVQHPPSEPCQTKCFVCTGKHSALFLPVHRENLKLFLRSEYWAKRGPMKLVDFLEFVQKLKPFHTRVFGVNYASTANADEKKFRRAFCQRHVEGLVLQLLAVGILVPFCKIEKNKNGKKHSVTFVRLGSNASGAFVMDGNAPWHSIPCQSS